MTIQDGKSHTTRQAILIEGVDRLARPRLSTITGALFWELVTERQAQIVARVTGAFAYWKSAARRLKCREREIAMFSPVIEDRLRALAAC